VRLQRLLFFAASSMGWLMYIFGVLGTFGFGVLLIKTFSKLSWVALLRLLLLLGCTVAVWISGLVLVAGANRMRAKGGKFLEKTTPIATGDNEQQRAEEESAGERRERE
jgi:hypothetical protein